MFSLLLNCSLTSHSLQACATEIKKAFHISLVELDSGKHKLSDIEGFSKKFLGYLQILVVNHLLHMHACNLDFIASATCLMPVDASIGSDRITLHLFQPHQADQMLTPQ